MIDVKSLGSVSVELSTIEAARILGLAVRSVQLMVDRGELQAWKTPGGHRRITKESVDLWMRRNAGGSAADNEGAGARIEPNQDSDPAMRILLIEDSVHFQNLVTLVVRHSLPHAELHVASDGISGLAMFGRLQPDILLVDILLPGIDGATLITSLRTSPQFEKCQLIVVTSLDDKERRPYAFALTGLPVIHKSKLAIELPALLASRNIPEPANAG